MFVISLLALILPVNFAIGFLGNNRWVWHLGVFAWFAWVAIGTLTNLLVAYGSVANMMRLGGLGWRRPRWWFELARFLLTTSLIFTVLALGSISLPQNAPQLAPGILLRCSAYGFAAFFVSATWGYALSFVRRLPRTGRAHECVLYFYSIVGGIIVVSYAGTLWPPPGAPPNGAAKWVIGLAGVALLSAGVTSMVIRHGRRERAGRKT